MRAPNIPVFALVVFALSMPGGADAQAPDPEALRTEFLAAYERARAGLPDLEADSAALGDYLLYPYLEAARLRRELPTATDPTDDAVRGFLAKHGDEPVARNLRAAWLESLAEREQWAAFLEAYRPDEADGALRCRHLAARIEAGPSDGLGPAIVEQWLTGARLPGACEPVFQWARDAGIVDAELTAERVRLLLDNGQTGFARVIAGRLPDAAAEPLLARANFLDHPEDGFRQWIDSRSTDFDADLLLAAWAALARDRPDTALHLFRAIVDAGLLEAPDVGRYTQALALGLAWDRRPEALDMFARIDEADADDYTHAWQARAALWAGDREAAAAAIGAMSAATRASPQWRYWDARTRGDRGDARALYRSILPRDNYFSGAAAGRLRDAPEPHPEPHPADEPIIAGLSLQPGIQRASELWLIGLTVAATREWHHAAAGFSADQRAQSIHLASRLGWFDRAVATATDVGIFFDYELLYPRVFREEVIAAADEFDLDPALVFAVIRQESLFRTDVRSLAGAEGLMQLKRGTAMHVNRQLGERRIPMVDLLDPATNIRLGAAEIARLLERYDGQLVVALAGYNAGPAAADRWLPESGDSVDGDIWLENVPYNETRRYVRRVLWHTVVYRWLDGSGTDAREWFGAVRRPRER